jgi:glycopeptide antibiotics resistance protein
LGLAVYLHQLTAAEVLQSYTAWEHTGRPEIARSERRIALYTFDEQGGNVGHDKTHSGVDLYIPETFQVVDKIALEPFWVEFEMSRSYWDAALKNIIGFIPFGVCFYAYLARLLPTKRATLVTVVLGAMVSATIEILQAFLPTRDSGTTDIITNTLGTWIGVVSYRLLATTLARFLPWLPLPPPRK